MQCCVLDQRYLMDFTRKDKTMIQRWKQWAHRLKTETYALYYAYKDPRSPWYAKLLAAFVVAHTLSPIDMIPDFIPVLGYLDDLIITPLGLALVLRMIPEEVMIDARQKAVMSMEESDRAGRVGMIIILCIWAIIAILVVFWLIKVIQG
jgi:uncharacterized membrane protein YkvA (DUF1232 family)